MFQIAKEINTVPFLRTSPRTTIVFQTCMVAAIVFVLLQLTPMRLIENYYDDYIMTAGNLHQSSDDKIVIVEIQETTLAAFPYRSPLDREFLATLIDKLNRSGVQAIGIDILIDQASEKQKDERLRQALHAAKDKVFIPQGTREDGLSNKQLAYQNEFISSRHTTNIVLGKDRSDGVVRHYLPGRMIAGHFQNHLAAAVAGVAVGNETAGFKRILFRSGETGKPYRYDTFPAESILLLPDTWFENKFVLIGKNILGIDQFRTPFTTISGSRGTSLPGVQVHAHILDQLLSNKTIVEFGLIGKLIAVLVGSLAAAALIRDQASIRNRCFLVLALTISLLVTGYFLFNSLLILVPAAAAAIAILFSAILRFAIIWQKDRSQKRFIRNAWAHYVSENVVESLIARPDALKPGGERIEATYIFTDIEGFTDISETLSPEILSRVINQYFDIMIKEFQRNDATLDKMVGDAIVGLVGAPLRDSDHANKAVSLALALDRKSQIFIEEMRKQKVVWGKTRIGINTGTAVVGNFGGSRFFDFTAIGDAVNTASRLEGANKSTGGTICVSSETARRANRHTFRPVGHLHLKGKKEAVETWEPVSELADKNALNAYRSAYDLLGVGSKAKAAFKSLAAKYPSDHLIQFHHKRLEYGETGTDIRIEK